MSRDRLEFGDHGESEDDLPSADEVYGILSPDWKARAPSDDEAAKLADALSLADGVEEALLAAEATAREGGEPDLGEVLARVHMLWSIGGIAYARGLLDEARDSVLEALRDSPLDSGDDSGVP